MTTYNTHNRATQLLQSTIKNTIKRSYTLSPEVELITIILFLALILSIAAVALVHTLAMFASALVAPLFTLMIPCAALISATLVPVLRNPIHALLCLLSLFAATGLIYLSLGAEYLGIVFIIVYLGAVAILFLYVIMLLNVKDIMSAQATPSSRGLRYTFSTAAGLLLFFHLPAEVQAGFQDAIHFSTDIVTGLDHSPTTELVSRLETDILHLLPLYGDN
jgi:NADH-quinone oxidoreductase subunit J